MLRVNFYFIPEMCLIMRPKEIVLFLLLVSCSCFGQVETKYNQFEIKAGDLVWKNTYHYEGKKDSLRAAVVQMLKSKFFTFNVIRNEAGYNGELKHYNVNCKQYGRTYFNTPRMYWEGEWSGKFIVEVTDYSYQVIVYALYYETMEKSTGYYKTEKEVKGRYIDAVTKKKQSILRKSEYANLALLSLSLKEAFNISLSIWVGN